MAALLQPSPRRVLIVENERDLADSLALFLVAMGYQVRKAYSAVDAIVATDAFQPDVAVLDIALPKHTCYDLARHMRTRLKESVLLIAITSRALAPDKDLAREAGFDHHFTKTADLDLVLSFIAHRRPAHA